MLIVFDAVNEFDAMIFSYYSRLWSCAALNTTNVLLLRLFLILRCYIVRLGSNAETVIFLAVLALDIVLPYGKVFK